MAFSNIQEEWAVVAAEGQPPLGAVRRVKGGHVMVHIENFGEVPLQPRHVAAAHDGKVVLALGELPDDVREAIGHAHDAEQSDAAVSRR